MIMIIITTMIIDHISIMQLIIACLTISRIIETSNNAIHDDNTINTNINNKLSQHTNTITKHTKANNKQTETTTLATWNTTINNKTVILVITMLITQTQ